MSEMIRNYLVQKKQFLAHLLFVAALTTVVSACGFPGDVKHTVSTVNEAVALLQDIDKHGTWEYISNGLGDLQDQEQGYTAVLHLRDGQVSSAGVFETPPKTEVTLDIQVDAAGNAQLRIVQNDQIEEYFIENYRSLSEQTHLYRVENGRYSCVKSGENDELLRNGLNSVFEQYALLATGTQLLSVAQEKGEAEVAGRDVTHYEVRSKVPDALKVLEKVDNQELRQKVREAGQFNLTGSLDIDRKTGALMRFESTHDDLDHQRRSSFSFGITRWGGVSDIPKPTNKQIILACE